MSSPTLKPPCYGLEHLKREFDELLQRLVTAHHAEASAAFLVPSVESLIEGDTLVIRADLPGVDLDKVEISVKGDVLTIRGSRERQGEARAHDFIHREVMYGYFERDLMLPGPVDPKRIETSYRDGVLCLKMPAPKESIVRRVPVSVGNP